MKRMKTTLVEIVMMATLFLASCGPGQPASVTGAYSGPQAWFDAPLPNSVIVPPNPISLVMHGGDVQGIASFELSANGAVVAEIPSPNTGNSLVTLSYDWHPPEPGRYLMTMRAKNNGGTWSSYAETIVLVAAADTPQAVMTIGTPTPTETPFIEPSPQPPTVTSTPERAPSISFEQVSSGIVYAGDASCGTKEVSITARAIAPAGIKVVILFYRFQADRASTSFEGLSMNPIGDDLYRVVLNPDSLLGGAIPFDQATLQYQAVIQQNDGDTSVRTPVMADIAVMACGSVISACSSFTDERTCIANGCQWVSIPGIVPLFECQNP
jgi:hypothetical protein